MDDEAREISEASDEQMEARWAAASPVNHRIEIGECGPEIIQPINDPYAERALQDGVTSWCGTGLRPNQPQVQYEYRVVNRYGSAHRRAGRRLSFEAADRQREIADRVRPHNAPHRVQRRPASWENVTA